MENNPKRKVSFVVERSTELGTFASVTAVVSSKLLRNGDNFVKALTQGVTEWVQTSEAGKACFDHAGDDLNIGDLLVFADPSLRQILEKFGIFEFCTDYDTAEHSGDWHFDTCLVDETQIESFEDKFIGAIGDQHFASILKDHNSDLDEKDFKLLSDRAIAFSKHTVPRSGDFIEFLGGITRRMSHVWWGESVQTSDENGGSYYLTPGGYMNFSGSLYPIIPIEALTIKEETRMGACWFFHHNDQTAHNGCPVSIPCRVWTTELAAN